MASFHLRRVIASSTGVADLPAYCELRRLRLSTICQQVINVQIRCQADDTDAANATQLKHRPISGDDDVGVRSKGAFQDAVIQARP